MPLIKVEAEQQIKDTVASAKTDLVVIIEFMMPECGACRSMQPKLEETRQKFPEVIFLEVDVNKLGPVADRFDIKTTPTFLFIKNKRVVNSFMGNKGDKFDEVLKQSMAPEKPEKS